MFKNLKRTSSSKLSEILTKKMKAKLLSTQKPQNSPSLVEAVRTLANVPSPIVTAPFPGCGGTCDEIERCYLACAQSTSYEINSCFCNILSWPTACANQCLNADERSSIAAWYWDVCSSKMDSQLGQIGLTRWNDPFVTVDSWAVPTATAITTLTGYNCYYSSSCSGSGISTTTKEISPGISASKTPNNRHAAKSLLVEVLVPILCVLILAATLTIFVFCYLSRHRSKRHRAEEHALEQNRRLRDDDQMVNLLQVIIDLLDRQQPAQPNQAITNEIQRANQSIAEIRTTVNNILVKLDERPAGQNVGDGLPENNLQEALKEQLSCPICFEVFHHPVTAINDETYQGGGCLHTFCGGCAVRLVRAANRHAVRCPVDRSVLRSFNEHRLLGEICEKYLEKYPEERRDHASLAAIDLLYTPGQRIL